MSIIAALRPRADALIQTIILLRKRAVFGRRAAFIAVIALLLASIASWHSLDLSLAAVDWRPLLYSAALVPVLITLTASEYQLVARTNGIKVPLRDALLTTIVGSVANLLPIPGTAAVRVGDLVSREGSAGRAVGSTLAAGLLWIAWALLLAGAALLIREQSLAGSLFAGLGIALLAVSAVMVRNPALLVTWLTLGSLVEIATILVGSLRLWLAFDALGLTAPLIGVLVLVAANAISSTIGIVPGGLGLREAVAAALAPLVDIDPAAAVLTVALTRVIGLALQAPAALLLTRSKSP